MAAWILLVQGVYVLYDTNFRWLKHFSSKVSKGAVSTYFRLVGWWCSVPLD
jgi:hypothetical protein